MSTPRTRVSVDPDVCQAAGYCVQTAPALFALGAEGVVTLTAGDGCGPIDVPADLVELVREAESDCPSGAITVCEE